MILDAVKDHIIPHIGQLGRAHEMWNSLTKTYQSSNENRKMVLREKLKSIQMAKGDTVTFYLTQFKQVRDELAAVGDSVSDSELVRTALLGVAPSWAIFVQAIVGRENMPSWDRLWDDFIQEEIRRGFTRGSTSSVAQVDENVALAAKGKGKGKSRKGPAGGGTSRGAGRGTGGGTGRGGG